MVSFVVSVQLVSLPTVHYCPCHMAQNWPGLKAFDTTAYFDAKTGQRINGGGI